MSLLRDRFIAASAGSALAWKRSRPSAGLTWPIHLNLLNYFDFCAKFHAHAGSPEPGSHDLACRVAGDEAIG